MKSLKHQIKLFFGLEFPEFFLRMNSYLSTQTAYIFKTKHTKRHKICRNHQRMIHNCKTPVVRQRKIVDWGMYKTVNENEYLCKYLCMMKVSYQAGKLIVSKILSQINVCLPYYQANSSAFPIRIFDEFL
jgi:hypothetical protein